MEIRTHLRLLLLSLQILAVVKQIQTGDSFWNKVCWICMFFILAL